MTGPTTRPTCGLYELEGAAPDLPADGDFWIAPGAVVVGDVRLRPGASIWFNAVVRGDNEPIEIGEGTNVQDGAVLHADPGYPLVLGPRVTVGHKAMVHGCTVGEGSLIGINAVVLNGARIGRGCLIGAGALIAEGKEIPDGALVMGAPGKVVRMLDAEARARLIETADKYRWNMRRFRDAMTPVRPA